jgi:transcriptional regulator with XRE-family HTH domain
LNILKKKRKELKLTQGEMATKLGVTQTTLSFYENKKHANLPITTIERIATAYGLGLSTVLKHFKGE